MLAPVSDLGPLERAALRALALAELLDVPLTIAGIWRTLPGYRTRLANVRASLAPGQPLRGFVREDRDRFTLRDRADLLDAAPARLGRADALWRDLKGRLPGVGRLPFVEGIALCGRVAWGLRDDERAGLVVFAEGGRADAARAAVRAWRRAMGRGADLRIAAVLDADALAFAAGGDLEAFWLLGLRPVVNEPALLRLWAANPWARARFPNFDAAATGGLPEYLVARRLDGRLAAARRRHVSDVDDGVLLTSLGRRGVVWDEALGDAIARLRLARPCALEWARASAIALDDELGPDAAGRIARRDREVGAWTAEDGRPEEAPEPSPSAAAAHATQASPAPEASTGPGQATPAPPEASTGPWQATHAPPEASTDPGQATHPPPEASAAAGGRSSRRRRGPLRGADADLGRRSPASSQEGQGRRMRS